VLMIGVTVLNTMLDDDIDMEAVDDASNVGLGEISEDIDEACNVGVGEFSEEREDEVVQYSCVDPGHLMVMFPLSLEA